MHNSQQYVGSIYIYIYIYSRGPHSSSFPFLQLQIEYSGKVGILCMKMVWNGNSNELRCQYQKIVPVSVPAVFCSGEQADKCGIKHKSYQVLH